MPDPNKLERLREISYRVQPSCFTCKQGRFVPGSNFGTCQLFDYEHRKHIGERRKLSVHVTGRCWEFKFNEKKKADLERSGFLEFVEELRTGNA